MDYFTTRAFIAATVGNYSMRLEKIWYNYVMFRLVTMLLLILIAFAVAWPVHATPRVVRSISEAKSLSQADFLAPVMFELNGQLIFTLNETCLVLEKDGHGILLTLKEDKTNAISANVKVGDLLAIYGHTGLFRGFFSQFLIDSTEVIGHRDLPSPEPATIDEILGGQHDLKFVTVRGDVVAVFKDDISTQWNYCILRDGEKVMYLAVMEDAFGSPWIKKIVGATVEATGLCGSLFGMRKFIRPGVCVKSPDAIRVIQEAPDPFDVPDLENPQSMSIDDVMRLGRRKVHGHVMATWAGNRILVKTSEGRIVRADLSFESIRPQPGAAICIAGTVTTDFFRLNLEDAVVRKLPDDLAPVPFEPIVDEDRFFNDIKCLKNKVLYFGKTICVTGTVNRIFRPNCSGIRIDLDTREMRITIEANSEHIPTSAIVPGCKVQVVGTFVTEGDNWRFNAPFPRICDWLLVVNAPDDILVIARPTWWTTEKFVVVIAILFVSLVGCFACIYALRMLANRQGRALFRAQIAHVGAQLRVTERTRLATELHDSLSQCLSGIACQINVARLTASDDETQKLLATTERMLQSSRTELTRCIGDLRSNMLEEPDFNAAIAKNLNMLSLPAEIHVAFAIPRRKVNDSTAHSILCIVRELVTNAVRHGRARNVEVTGGLDDRHLEFSVTDNGCGFDTNHYSGISEGHFGLEGIRDRVNRLGGTFEIASSPQNGTVARVSISITSHLEAEII